MKQLIFTIIIFMMGVLIGYFIHPDPIWDIGEDERACTIIWDDGTASYKSCAIHIGTLEPGESKTIEIRKEN